MGGLVADVEDIYDNLSQVTLTPSGVLRFARTTGWERFLFGRRKDKRQKQS